MAAEGDQITLSEVCQRLQYFGPGSLKGVFTAADFVAGELCGDVAGSPFSIELTEFAIVARKQRLPYLSCSYRKAVMPISSSDAALSGLAYLRGILGGRTDPPPVAGLVGYRLVSVEEGLTLYELLPRHSLTNPFGTVHGGILTTLLDTAMTAAVWSKLGAGRVTATMALNVNFIRPVAEASGVLRCEGRSIHVGRRTATAEGRLTDAAGRLCAHGTATCAVRSI